MKVKYILDYIKLVDDARWDTFDVVYCPIDVVTVGGMAVRDSPRTLARTTPRVRHF